MSFEYVPQQEFAVRVLRTHLERKRVAQTYLITGKASSGSEEIASAFAAALNCDRAQAFEECACLSCRKVLERNHPDIHWLGEDESARSIKIEEVRKLIGRVALKPYEGRYKVFILKGADRLTADGANALLKTLEEPPKHTVFLLLVEAKINLLETIQSRAFEIRLKPLDPLEAGPSPIYQEFFGKVQVKPEDYFQAYEKSTREDVKRMLDQLMHAYRDRIAEETKTAAVSSAFLGAHLEALEAVGETKDAVASNVNHKLALSRLAMQIKKSFRGVK